METQNTTASAPLAPIVPMLWQQLKIELLRLWRTPSFLVPTVILPLVLYIILGGLGRSHGLEGGVSQQIYALASVGTYSIVLIMLYSFGVNMANERAQRVNVLMRATPLPATIYLLAKIISALLSALVMLLILSVIASIIGGVQLSASAWITLAVSLLLGVLPFTLLGFAIGQVINPTGAGSLVNLAFFALAFASGLFVPLSQLPSVVQSLAPYSPFYCLGQLAWNAIGVSIGSLGNAIWLLLLYGVVFCALALLAYRREDRNTFG
jgi:ABC-2 type transport system permease protein